VLECCSESRTDSYITNELGIDKKTLMQVRHPCSPCAFVVGVEGYGGGCWGCCDHHVCCGAVWFGVVDGSERDVCLC
jgi:hypothetical protein